MMFQTLLLILLATASAPAVKTGADRLTQEPFVSLVKNKRVGLITNQTGISREFKSTIEILEDIPGVQLVALFGPEHGLEGNEQAGRPVSSGARVFSLYGENRSPTPEMLRDIDVLVYDIQDVGSRFYTFISTMFECMKAASEAGLSLVVLDRPVPINGQSVEGPVLSPGFESFVGAFPLPIRHGMTVGELARLYQSEKKLPIELTVVPMENWRRDIWFDETGLPWVSPSPNMPTMDTATVYPGTCLIEGTNLSEGRGTTKPFELIGAPWLDNKELARRLNALSLPGAYFRPQTFSPMFSKYSGEKCRGIQVHVTDRRLFSPIDAVLHLLAEIRKLHPGLLEFRSSFDRLAGNAWIREKLQQGEHPDKIIGTWLPGLETFKNKRQKYLLYE